MLTLGMQGDINEQCHTGSGTRPESLKEVRVSFTLEANISQNASTSWAPSNVVFHGAGGILMDRRDQPLPPLVTDHMLVSHRGVEDLPASRRIPALYQVLSNLQS